MTDAEDSRRRRKVQARRLEAVRDTVVVPLLDVPWYEDRPRGRSVPPDRPDDELDAILERLAGDG